MRFEALKARGIGPFTHVDIDLAGISGLLVAITGENGAGKSTLLELFPGALFRDTPTRGTLGHLATKRDAFLEVRAVNGATRTLRHLVNAVSGKGESVVLDEDGRPLTDAAQRREFDGYAKAHFPAPEVLFASTFAAQGGGGFLEMKPTERKKVLLRVLGIERLEAIAARAGERARAAKASCEIAQQRIDEAQRGAVPLTDATERLAVAEQAHRAALLAQDEAREALATATRLADEYDRVIVARRAALAAIAKLEHDLADARFRADAAGERAARGPEIEAARARIAEAELRLERELAAEAEAQRACDALDAELREVRRAGSERAIIEDRLVALEAQLETARARLAALRPIIHRAAAIRDAQKRLVELDAVLVTERAAYETRKAISDAAKTALARANVAFDAARRRETETRAAVERYHLRLRDEDRVRAAVEELAASDASVIEMRRELGAIDEDLAREQAAALTSKDGRIADLRTALEDIADDSFHSPDVHAAKALEIDTERMLHEAEGPARIGALRKRAGELRVEIETTERKATEARRLAARVDEMAAARADLAGAQAAFERAGAALRDASEDVGDLNDLVWSAGRYLKETVEQGQRTAAERKELAALAADAEALARAEAEREALDAEVSRIATEQARDRDALAALPTPDTSVLEHRAKDARFVRESASGDVAKTTVLLRNDREVVAGAEEVARAAADRDAALRDVERLTGELTAQKEALAALPRIDTRPDVEEARQAEERAQRAVSTAADALSRARVTLEASEAAAARTAELREEAAAYYEELADWNRLAADLGKDGIQALEIDAAGPELTAIANDLLHTCVSRRWTIAIHTQRLASDGKRMLEGCEVEITDVEAGRVGAAETFSGGERVLIGEAVSLALSVLACRRMGVERPTLVRDESGAALDASNGRAYVEMLRRAGMLIGADKVLYVSHSPELQELADARIHVEGGTAAVVPVDYQGGGLPRPERNAGHVSRADYVQSLDEQLEFASTAILDLQERRREAVA